MSDAMAAEFDTVADWTAKVADSLGPDYHLPAACRGSGSPAALDWLIDALELGVGDLLVDSGAGVGGPAAYAAERVGVDTLLVEPEAGACRAARRLFAVPVAQGSGSRLPVADQRADAAWSLGVMCTMQDQRGLLTELSRVVRPPGRVGLLVFVATAKIGQDEQPEGNNFPTVATVEKLVARSGLAMRDRVPAAELADVPQDWQRRADTVETELRRRYGHERAWRLAETQSDRMGRLIADGAVVGMLFSLRHRS